MDLNLSEKKVTSFRLFQGKILEEYEKMIPEFGFHVMDATQPIHNQQKEIRQVINGVLRGWEGLPNPVQSAQIYTRKKKAAEQKEVNHG
jgi:dTMP kinase